MLKTKIYIAGKITGDPNYKEKFAKMESELLKIPGTTVINPAALPTGLEPADYARICFAMINSSDIVVFAPNYKKSQGALLEMQYCRYIQKAWVPFEEYIMRMQPWDTIRLSIIKPVAESAELALQTCECPGARAWRSKEKQIDEACFNIESLCVANARELGMTEIENDEIIDILKKTARLIADAKVFDLTVTTVGHGKVKIGKSGKGSISVKRTVGHTEELKANEKY